MNVDQQSHERGPIAMMDTQTAHLLDTYNATDQTLFAAVANLPESDVYRQARTLFGWHLES